MPRFRKKPMEVEAFLWTRNGDHPMDYAKDITDNGETITGAEQRENAWEGQLVRYFRSPDVSSVSVHEMCGHIWHEHGWIDTGRYGHTVCPGDWIIQDAVGEYYPCRPDVFVRTYDPI